MVAYAGGIVEVEDLYDVTELVLCRLSDSAAKVNNTLASDDTLFTPELPANSSWIFEGWLWVTSALDADPDFKAQFLGPSGASGAWSLWGQTTAATTAIGSIDHGIVATPFSSAHARGAIAGGGLTLLANGYMQIDATPGAVTLQWAQNTTDAGSGIVLKEGSHLRFKRVA